MALYNLYAGLGGGFGGSSLVATDEYESLDAASSAAYELAIEEYQGMEGLHGVLSREECAIQILVQEGLIDNECEEYNEEIHGRMIEENDLEEEVQTMYDNEIESWIDYHAVLAEEDEEVEDDEIED